jgi:hypothetical protein
MIETPNAAKSRPLQRENTERHSWQAHPFIVLKGTLILGQTSAAAYKRKLENGKWAKRRRKQAPRK